MPDVLGLSFPTKEEAYVVAVARCRELAIGIAAAAAVGEEDDAEAAREYARCLDVILTDDVVERFGDQCAEELRTARAFGERITGGADSGMSCEDGRSFLAHARHDVVPGLARISSAILKRAAEDQNAILESLQGRIDQLEALFSSMSKVGRTIHLVSLNAAIEASRSGGEAGRAFGTIATEIRTLAAEAEGLVSRARDQIEDGRRRR